MSSTYAEKTDAIVIRLADFSESSKVVTLFTRDFGKVSALAKGAKRLKSAFEAGLDLLSECRVVFIPKSGTALDLLTESQLVRRFQPLNGSLSHLYAGYYVAEILNALSEHHDPNADLFEAASLTLAMLHEDPSPMVPVTWFEFVTLQSLGQLPDFETCTICQSEINIGESARFWVSQSGLICSRCGHSEYEASEFHADSLEALRQLLTENPSELKNLQLNPRQRKEIRRLATAAISHVMGRKPKTLPLINMN